MNKDNKNFVRAIESSLMGVCNWMIKESVLTSNPSFVLDTIAGIKDICQAQKDYQLAAMERIFKINNLGFSSLIGIDCVCDEELEYENTCWYLITVNGNQNIKIEQITQAEKPKYKIIEVEIEETRTQTVSLVVDENEDYNWESYLNNNYDDVVDECNWDTNVEYSSSDAETDLTREEAEQCASDSDCVNEDDFDYEDYE